MERRIKLALVQMESKKGELDINIDKIEFYAKKAGMEKADLIVFPELCTCGYYPNIFLNYRESTSIRMDDSRMKRLCCIAKDSNINMVVGVMLDRGEYYTNSAVLIDKCGEIVTIHDKVYLWDDEKKAFKSGREFHVTELPFGKIGIMICYDAGFPENARKMALNGAELLVIPAAFAEIHRHRWDIYYRTRALENTCWVAGVNAAGGDGQDEYFGNNVLFDPAGYSVTEGNDYVEEMQIAEINLSAADMEHKMESYIGDLIR